MYKDLRATPARARRGQVAHIEGLDEQRRIIESIAIPARDKATVRRLLERMEQHYYSLLREKDARGAALAEAEASMSVRLGVLEKVAAAVEAKHAVELRAVERLADERAADLQHVRAQLERAQGLVDMHEDDKAACVLAVGTDLARAEALEVELRQVVGFLRSSGLARDAK